MVWVLFVAHNTEVALDVWYFRSYWYVVWLVGGAVQAHILLDKCDSAILENGHNFFTIFSKEQLYSDPENVIAIRIGGRLFVCV